uniref:Uncharacterized protein n=1 Tax=Vibrio nigripulchritudo TaxID=28173 RepID=A0A9P1NK99_9VIBR|nr:Protein of unknown function [Vibrio nigripulchritudo]
MVCNGVSRYACLIIHYVGKLVKNDLYFRWLIQIVMTDIFLRIRPYECLLFLSLPLFLIIHTMISKHMRTIHLSKVIIINQYVKEKNDYCRRRSQTATHAKNLF